MPATCDASSDVLPFAHARRRPRGRSPAGLPGRPARQASGGVGAPLRPGRRAARRPTVVRMSAPARSSPTVTAEPLSAQGADGLPTEFAPKRLLRRSVQVVALLGAVVLAAVVAPGLGEVRERLGEAAVGLLALAVGLEVLSCSAYVLLFRGVFCPRMSWRTSSQIAWSELGAGSLV